MDIKDWPLDDSENLRIAQLIVSLGDAGTLDPSYFDIYHKLAHYLSSRQRSSQGTYVSPPFSSASGGEISPSSSPAAPSLHSQGAAPVACVSPPLSHAPGEETSAATSPACSTSSVHAGSHAPATELLEDASEGSRTPQMRDKKRKQPEPEESPGDAPEPPESGPPTARVHASQSNGECPQGSIAVCVHTPGRTDGTVRHDCDVANSSIKDSQLEAAQTHAPQHPPAKKRREDAQGSSLPQHSAASGPAPAPSTWRDQARRFLQKLAERLPVSEDKRARAFTTLLRIVSENHGQVWHAPPRQDSVSTLATRINHIHSNMSVLKWVEMLDKICLAGTVDDIEARERKTLVQIHDAFKAKGCLGLPNYGTFSTWLQQGRKCALLASAGSIFVALAVAQFKMLCDVTDSNARVFAEVLQMLRDPDYDASAGAAVTATIIPWVQYCQSRLHVRLDGIFSKTLCEREKIGTAIDTWDLLQSDTFFEAFARRDYPPKPRNLKRWKPCLSPQDSPTHKVTVSLSGVQVISCDLQPVPQVPIPMAVTPSTSDTKPV